LSLVSINFIGFKLSIIISFINFFIIK
jgi:hypothetical protein